jgi:dTDP-4-amino-4,6-dideoxygalactose transaminase
MQIPFNKSVQLENGLATVEEALRNGQLSGNGIFTKRCELLLERNTGQKNRIVTSATHALEMMALLIDIRPGDEIIVPSFTFVSTANSFALRGATIRFADNDNYGNILPSEVERLLSSKTRAVVAVDYAGASADLDALSAICARVQNKVHLFEDAAQAIGATYNGKPLGTLGALGCFSFHDTKNISSGEGGALIISDERFLERAEILREKGTNRSRFLRGLEDKYTWVDIGSSYVASELNTAFLLPQLEQLDRIIERRGEIWERYARELRGALSKREVEILGTPAHNTPNYHMFSLLFPSGKQRDSFIDYMRTAGITCPFHYVPLHTSPFGVSLSSQPPERLSGCEKISGRLVRMPVYYNLTRPEQDYVLERATDWFNCS